MSPTVVDRGRRALRALGRRYPPVTAVMIILYVADLGLGVVRFRNPEGGDIEPGGEAALYFSLQAVRACVLVLLLLRPRVVERRFGVLLLFALVNVLAMNEVWDQPEATALVAVWALGMGGIIAMVGNLRAAVVYNSVSTVCIVVLLMPPAEPMALVFQSFSLVGVVAAPPLTTLWLRLRLERATSEARVQAETDALTGLLNRRGLVARLPGLVARARETGAKVVVMAADIDHFKRVNDTFGHDVGDEVLVSVARELGARIRAGQDVLARSGGEEFVAVLVSGDGEAGGLAERMRQGVPGATRPHPVTVSVGVAAGNPPPRLVDPVAWVQALMSRADACLYEAKETGRDRVVMAA